MTPGTSSVRPARLHVIGTGLIGVSFALAARASGCFSRITGADLIESRLDRAIELGALDAAGEAGGADAVLVAVPVGQVADVVIRLGVAETTSVFDVGSVKQPAIARLVERLGRLPPNFIPCHPMAGSEQSGPDAAEAGLFRARPVFVTPQDDTDPEHLGRVCSWWQACGAEVRETTAELHDHAVGLTSHLPHLLAAAFVASIADRALEPMLEFAGPGFADFTRIAGGDPALWRDITASNRDSIGTHLDGYLKRLGELRRQLADGRLDDVERMLVRAQELKHRGKGEAAR